MHSAQWYNEQGCHFHTCTHSHICLAIGLFPCYGLRVYEERVSNQQRSITVCQLFSVAMDRAETQGPQRQSCIRPSHSLWPPAALIEDDRKREREQVRTAESWEEDRKTGVCGVGQLFRSLHLSDAIIKAEPRLWVFPFLNVAGLHCLTYKRLSETRQSGEVDPWMKLTEWHLGKDLHNICCTHTHGHTHSHI